MGREFITLWLGNDYTSVYYCAVLLLLPAPFYLSQQIGKNTMVMVDKIRYLTYVNVVKAGMNKKQLEGAFKDEKQCILFREELKELQNRLICYTGLLADMAEVEDLTAINLNIK